jgi:Phage portal protein, SPP1 Gp6-like
VLTDLAPVNEMVRLAATLDATYPILRTQDCYYRGVIPFPFREDRYSEVYRRIQKEARPKWGKLIVSSAAQRLAVEGFLPSGRPDPSEEVWEQFVATGLDLMQHEVHLEALKHGRAYVSLWPQVDGNIRAVPESPWEVVHWRSPDRSQQVAVKVWPEDNVWRARLFTADAVYAWVAPRNTQVAEATTIDRLGHFHSADELPRSASAWAEDGPPMPNPFAPQLPIVPFVVGAHMNDALGRSELVEAIDIIDRIMSLQMDLMLVSKVMGFPVRWATGVESPVDDHGQPAQTFTTQIERFLTTDSPDARFGQLPAADLRQIASTIGDVVTELAAVTETPSSVLQSSNLANPASAEALRAQEIPLVHRVKRHQREFAVPWVHVARLLSAESAPMEVMWADAEVHSEAALTDSLVKQVAGLGVPREAAWEQLPDTTPTTVARWRAMAASQAIEDRMAMRLDAVATGDNIPQSSARKAGPSIDQANIANPSNPGVIINTEA